MANVPPPSSAPAPGRYRHFKGGRYEVLGVGRHSETEEWLVIYRSEREGGTWLRPLSSWIEPAMRNGEAVARFSRDDEAETRRR